MQPLISSLRCLLCHGKSITMSDIVQRGNKKEYYHTGIYFQVQVFRVDYLANETLQRIFDVSHLLLADIMDNDIDVGGMSPRNLDNRSCCRYFLVNRILDDIEMLSHSHSRHNKRYYLEKLKQQVILSSIVSITKQGQHYTFNKTSILLPFICSRQAREKSGEVFGFRLEKVEELLVKFEFPLSRVIKSTGAGEWIAMCRQDRSPRSMDCSTIASMPSADSE